LQKAKAKQKVAEHTLCGRVLGGKKNKEDSLQLVEFKLNLFEILSTD